TAFGMEFVLMLFAFFLIILLLVRKTWLAWLLWAAPMIVLTILAAPTYQPVAFGVWLSLYLGVLGLGVFVLARYGLLAVCVLQFTVILLRVSPLTTDPSAWYFWQGIWTALVCLALAAYAFYTATGCARLFKDGFFGDD